MIGHQFWWEFRYPKLGIVTANELHIPVVIRATRHLLTWKCLRPTPSIAFGFLN